MKTLVRFDPFRDLEAVMETLWSNGPKARATQMDPIPLNIKETEAAWVIEAQLPGVKEEDVRISVEEGLLTVSTQVTQDEVHEGEGYRHQEWRAVSQSRSLRLPENVQPESASAKLNHGVLTLTIQKVEPAKPKAIEIALTKEG